MEPVYFINLLFYIGTLVLFSFVISRIYQKYRERKNKTTKWLLFVLLFYAFSLSSVLINTVLEYILEVYPEPWNWGFQQAGAWYYYFQYILQFSCLRDAMIIIANLFLILFYYELFVHEQTRLSKILFWVYTVTGVFLIALYLVGVYLVDLLNYGYSFSLDELIIQLTQSRNKLILLLVHTGGIFIPLLVKSLLLRYKLIQKRKKKNVEMIRKFNFIFLMVVFYLGIYVFALLDVLSATSYSIWFYLTFVSESMAAVMAYFGFVRKLKNNPHK